MKPEGWVNQKATAILQRLPPGELYDKRTRREAGRVAIIDQSIGNYFGFHDDEPGVDASTHRPVITFANHTCAVRIHTRPFSVIQNVFPIKTSGADVRFIFHWLQGRVPQSGYQGHWPKLAEQTIHLPPLWEQKKIAAILTAVDEAIEATQAVIDQLQVVKKALMSELFTRGIPGRHKGQKIGPLGPMPEAWEVVRIRDLVNDMRGGSPLQPADFSSEGFLVLHKGDIRVNGELALEEKSNRRCTESFARRYAKSIVEAPFVAVTLRDLVPSGPTIGLAAAIPSGARLLLAQGAYGVLFQDRILNTYFVALTNSAAYRAAVQRIAVGSTQIHIRNNEFLDLEIPLPPVEEQTALAKLVEALDERFRVETQRAHCLLAAKTAAASVLLSGTVRVPNV